MPYIAGGIKISLPELMENQYVLWYIQDISFLKWLKILLSLYMGKFCGTIKIMDAPCSISCMTSASVEFDGDPHGQMPVNISFFSEKLNLISPNKRGLL